MTNNIRRPLFDGMREVRGLWFDVELIGENEARQRIFRNWEPGARLYREFGGYVLEYPNARLCRCADLDGLALCEIGRGLLSSAPLADNERAALTGVSVQGAVCLVRDTQAEFGRLDAAKRIDPAIWLDLRSIPVREPLQPPRSGEEVALGAVERPKPLREILGDAIPPPSAAREAFLRDAAAVRQGKGSRRGSVIAAAMSAGVGVVALGALGLLAKITGVGTSSSPVTGKGGTGGNAARPSQLSPWARRLNDAIAKLTVLTGASKLLGMRHAAYMRRMLDMLDEGDWHEALRHAIPLHSPQSESVQAYGLPGRRDDLTIRKPGGITSSIGMDGLNAHLRKVYRQVFERLDRERRVDEAVYVLAELLRSGMEAATYLEGKGRFSQAAELAETLELPPDLIVRLWWLARNIERAVMIARRSNAFSGAVLYLEKAKSAEATGLRREWAQHLAAQGSLVEAATTIWPLAEERALAREWLLAAESADGTLGIRALVHKLALAPETLKDSVATIENLLRAEGEQAAMERIFLARSFLQPNMQSEATKRVLAALLRVILPERQAGLNRFEAREFEKLLVLADAPVLRADLPTLRFPDAADNMPLMARQSALTLQMDERGMQPICDARFVTDGQYLLALGENGVLRIDRRGRTLAHYPVPAHGLVLSENGQRALALARRDGSVRIARLDLLTARVRDWVSLPLRHWSHTYDGVTWNVVLDNRLVALDTTADKLTPTWQIADLPGVIVGFVEDNQCQVLLLQEPDGQLQQWRYALPARRLLARDPLPPFDSDVQPLLHGNHAAPLKLRLIGSPQDGALLVQKPGKLGEFRVPLGELLEDWPIVKVHQSLLAVMTQDRYRAQCRIVDLSSGSIKADLTLLDAQRPLVHLYRQHVIFGDGAGRLIDIDCLTGIAQSLTVN